MATTDSTTPSAPPLRIIIIGGGIAGLAAARAVRGPGHQILVLEQTRMKTEIGAAIHLGVNAAKIVKQWGFDPKRVGSVVCTFYREHGSSGKLHVHAPNEFGKIFGADWLLNHRVDLHNELRKLATEVEGPGTPAEIKTGAKVESIDTEAGKVTLADGEVIEGDVIIGADGIHSITRTAVIGQQRIAQPSGHSAYRCLIPAEKLKDDPDWNYLLKPPTGMECNVGPDRRVISYPCRNCEFLNIVAIVPDKYIKQKSNESWNEPGVVSEMVDCYSEFPERVRRLLGYADSCILWQLRDQDPLDTWVKGRTIIIGDAAHAMVPHQGQGGSQAIEDAEALQVYLENLTSVADRDRVPKALQDVFNVRIARASKIQAHSRNQALPPKEDTGLDAMGFAKYNFGYFGARAWAAKMVEEAKAQSLA